MVKLTTRKLLLFRQIWLKVLQLRPKTAQILQQQIKDRQVPHNENTWQI